jgi:hypothetical protein
MFDVTIVIVLGRQESAHIRRRSLTASPTGRSPVTLPLLGSPHSLRHNIEIRPINNLKMAPKCSSVTKSRASLA